MAEKIEQRDFFISFNSADLPYAEAVNAALRDAKFTTFFHPADIEPGDTIPKWMDDALMNSSQMLALCSPEYFADEAVYSEAERYARFWQDARGAKFKLVPVELRKVVFPPLMAVRKRIDATNRSPAQAAEAVVAALKKPEQSKEREEVQQAQPLPSIFNVLYRPNPNFTGRFEAMESLQNSLRAGGNAAITAVAGLGGVGKTTLAAEYCHRFGSQYGGVWWVRAEQESVMLSDLVELGRRLKLEQTGNIETDARATLDYLRVQPNPWLMVFDNAPNPDAVRKWLPAGGQTRCIVTSRFVNFDDIAPVTRLDQWSDEVTKDYLLTRTGRDDKEGAMRLANTLGGLPLAAEQAAVFLGPSPDFSFDEYAREIAKLISEKRPEGAEGQYEGTVYGAFVKSLESVAIRKDGAASLDVLRLCAFLSPDGVGLELLAAAAEIGRLPDAFAAAMGDKLARRNALAVLASLSLLRQEEGPFGSVLIFHRILLEVVRDWMGAEARTLWGEGAVELVDFGFPNDVLDPAKWSLCARLMVHLRPLEANVPDTRFRSSRLARLFNQACVFLAVRGDPAALEFAEKAVALGRPTLEDDPQAFATRVGNLGTRYVAADRLDDAEAAFREALQIRERYPEDPRLAYTLNNLAEIPWKRRDFAKAEPLLLRAKEVIKAGYGPRSAEYGSSLGNLDSLYDDWAEISGDAEKRMIARGYSEDALAVTLAARGTRHPETAARYYNLSVLKLRLGDLSSTSEAERSLAIMLSLDLAEHPDASTFAVNLSRIWRRANETARAVRLEHGDLSDLLPVVEKIEEEHQSWIADDPAKRHFGPPSLIK